MAAEPGRPFKIYVVSADGGSAQQVTTGERNEADPSWSADGNSLVFGRLVPFYAGTGTVAIHSLDLRTKQISTLPGSEGLCSPAYSPDGRYIAALTVDVKKLMLFNSSTRNWTELCLISPSDTLWESPTWSHDGKYIYFARVDEVSRIRLVDRKVQQVNNLKDVRLTGSWGSSFALTPDDSPLALRDAGTQEIYTLNVEFP